MDNLSSAIISLAETEVKLSLHFPMDVLGIVAWIRFAELRRTNSFAYGGPGSAFTVVVFLRPSRQIIADANELGTPFPLSEMVEAGGVGIFRGIENT